MDSVHKQALQENTLYLQDNIIATPTFRTRLALVLPKESVDDIFVLKTVREQVASLVDLLCRRGASALPCFIDILRDTKQEFIATHLQKEIERFAEDRDRTAKWVASCQVDPKPAEGVRDEAFCTRSEVNKMFDKVTEDMAAFKITVSDKVKGLEENLRQKSNELEASKKEIQDLKLRNQGLTRQRDDSLSQTSALTLALKEKENKNRQLEEEVIRLRRQLATLRRPKKTKS